MAPRVVQESAMFMLRPWIGSCSATMARLSDHLERALPARDDRRVHRHLRRCPRCRAVYESLVRTVEHVRALGRLELEQPMPSIAPVVAERIRRDLR